MTDKPKIGGYVYDQTLTRIENAAASMRLVLHRLIEEDPGQAWKLRALARLALDASEITDGVAVLKQIGRNGKQTGQLPPLEE